MFHPTRSKLFLSATLIGQLWLSPSVLADTSEYDNTGEKVIEEGLDGVLELNDEGDEAHGTFHHDEAELWFRTKVHDGFSTADLELRGMVLNLTLDHGTVSFDIDGFAADNGQDTQMTAADRAVIQAMDRTLAALGQEPDQRSPAVDLLVRTLTAFGQYADSMSLSRRFHPAVDYASSLCGNVNKPGQGGTANTFKYVQATHDCDDTAGDCSNWWGCSRWDDNSTTNNVFLSMHPDGGCSDGTYFGDNPTSLNCHEPDHPGAKEYAYGGCFGRCGAGCGSGTQFTRDCVDHDHCVRFGHSLASFWCGDELTGATADAITASHCSGVNFTVDYNWTGSGNENNCPTSWKDTNDGCDHGCQFVDGDCFR